MAEGLDSQDEEEAEELSPAVFPPSPASSQDPTVNHPHPVSTRSPHEAIRVVDREASRFIDQDIAQALAADAAFLEDPAMSLGEGALQPLGAGYEEGYELPALSAGGTISKVLPLRPVIHFQLVKVSGCCSTCESFACPNATLTFMRCCGT